LWGNEEIKRVKGGSEKRATENRRGSAVSIGKARGVLVTRSPRLNVRGSGGGGNGGGKMGK